MSQSGEEINQSAASSKDQMVKSWKMIDIFFSFLNCTDAAYREGYNIIETRRSKLKIGEKSSSEVTKLVNRLHMCVVKYLGKLRRSVN